MKEKKKVLFISTNSLTSQIPQHQPTPKAHLWTLKTVVTYSSKAFRKMILTA